MNKPSSISQHVFFFILFAVLAGFVLYISLSYLNLFAIACVYAVFVYPLYKWLMKKYRLKAWIAVLIIMLLTILLIVIPLVIIVYALIYQVLEFVDNLTNNVDPAFIETSILNFNKFLSDIKLSEFRIDLTEIKTQIAESLASVAQTTAKTLQVVLSVSFASIFGFLMFVVMTFVLIPNGEGLVNFIKSLVPMDSDIKELYFRRSKLITVDIVKGTFVIAGLQGIIAGGFCYFLGIPNSLLIGFMASIASFIPVFGTALAMVPIAVFYLLTGDYFIGISLLLWQIFVVATIDNVIRPFLVSDEVHIHPALMLFAYLGGIKVFGPIGLIFGPLIFVLFLTTLEVFQKHYLNKPVTIKGLSEDPESKIILKIPGMKGYVRGLRKKLEGLGKAIK